MALSDELDLLATSIRQLQSRWDMFFSGIEKIPPTEAQKKVENVIREHAFSEIRNNTDRFRYQGLTARFNSLNELWKKRLRAREEGKVFGLHGLKAEVLPPPPPPPEPEAASGPRATPPPGGSGGEFRVGDADRDQAAVQALYNRFVEERQRTGEGAAPAFESFRQLIGKQTAKIIGDRGARAVDFRLDTKDGKVALKAKVVK